jgi:hypothetical protein
LGGAYLDEEGLKDRLAVQESFRLEDYPATARVMETMQPLVVQASDPDADPAELAYMREYGVKTLAIIPLAVKGESIGVVELESVDEEIELTQEQIDLAMTLANQAAVALDNARLFQQTARRAEQERLASDITAKIRAATSVDGIVRVAAHELGQVLETSRVLVRVGMEDGGKRGTGPLPPLEPGNGEEPDPGGAEAEGELDLQVLEGEGAPVAGEDQMDEGDEGDADNR